MFNEGLSYALMGLMFIPLFAVWAVIVILPMIATVGGGAILVYSFLEKPQLLAQSYRKKLISILEELKSKLPGAKKVCACTREVKGVTYLAVQYVSQAGKFSHLVKAKNLNDAIAKSEYKIKHNLKCHKSCGNGHCVMEARCPNRIGAKDAFSEIYR